MSTTPEQPFVVHHDGEIDLAELAVALAGEGMYLEKVTAGLPEEVPQRVLEGLPQTIRDILTSPGNNPFFLYVKKPAPLPLTDEEIADL